MWPQPILTSGAGWNTGNEVSARGNPQDWATYYQSMPANQVDWGSLAQQWIAMKTENTSMVTPGLENTEPPPPAPGEEALVVSQPSPMGAYAQWPPIHLPPPNVHTHDLATHNETQPPLPPAPPLPTTPHPTSQPEGGVADMDMDEDDEIHGSSNNDWGSKQPINHSESHDRGRGISNQEEFNTNSRGAYKPLQFGGPSPHPPGGGWIHKSHNQVLGRGRGNAHSMGQIPPLMDLTAVTAKGMDSSSSNYNASSHSYASSSMLMGSMASLDAAARKKLPPWIREGLEKMEREKQKKEDELLKKKLREEKLRKRREEELNMDEKRKQDPRVSKFDDMNSNSETDEETNNEYLGRSYLNDKDEAIRGKVNQDESVHKRDEGNAPSQRKRPSRFDEKVPSPYNTKEYDENKDVRRLVKEAPKKHLTKDEILEEMSIVLKRTLTEILLEVTTEEIESAAKDALSSAQRQQSKSVLNAKIRANRAFKKNTISTLGLTDYGSESDKSDQDSDQSDQNSGEESSDSNSDDELKERLKQRRRQFERTEDSILNECADMEKRLERREKVWKESDSSNDRRRHESKGSNHSDSSEKSKKSHPKVFETISAAVGMKSSVDSSSEIETKRLILNNETKLTLQSSECPRARQSITGSHNDDQSYSDKADTSCEEESSEDSREKIIEKSKRKETIKKSSRRRSSSTEEDKGIVEHRSKRKHRSRSREKNNASPSQDSEKSRASRRPSKERIKNSENGERRSHHKSNRRSREKNNSSGRTRSRSPRSKHKRSKSRSRSRHRSENKYSHRDRHRSKSKERKSSFTDHKASSSRRKRSRSRDERKSRRSRSCSREGKSHRRKRHGSSSSEASTVSYASGKNKNRRERRDSDTSSSSRHFRKRSRS